MTFESLIAHPATAFVAVTVVVVMMITVVVNNVRHHRAIAAARQQPLPVKTIEINPIRSSASALSPLHHDTSGRIMLVLCGTFAEHLGDNLLNLLHRCGLEQAIGSVLLIELDARRRDRFLQSMPNVYHDRLEVVSFSGLAGGMGNEEPDVVLGHIHAWGPSLVHGAHEVSHRHRLVNHGAEPALVLTFISQGGQAILGPEALRHIRRQFTLAKHYAFTALPVDDLLRHRVPAVLDAYRDQGVRGFVVSDNRADSVINDFGMVGAITGFIAASEAADSPTEQNNAWHQLFTHAPGGIVSFSTHTNRIPGYVHHPHKALVPRYYVYGDSVRSVIHAGLEAVALPEARALPGFDHIDHVPLTSRFEIVLGAVVPDDFKQIEDEVLHGLELKGTDRRNHHLVFAPISEDIDPGRPQCPIAVVSLYALPDGHAAIETLTVVTHEPAAAPQLVDHDVHPAPTNGHHPVAANHVLVNELDHDNTPQEDSDAPAN